MDFLLAGKTEGVSKHYTMSTNTNTMSSTITTCPMERVFHTSPMSSVNGEEEKEEVCRNPKCSGFNNGEVINGFCNSCRPCECGECDVVGGSCPCAAGHDDDDEDCEKCGHHHSCEENHCENCCRGKFCNCNDANCPYCKILRAFSDARTKSVKWWDNQI